MSEKDLYHDEYMRRKKNMRPDALVIPEDVLRVMRIPKSDWTPSLKIKIQQCIDQAKEQLFPGQCIESVPLILHQQFADKVVVYASILASTDDLTRIEYLRSIISNSQITAHTNYQFVRHFIRRNIHPILLEKELPVPDSWNVTVNVNINVDPSLADNSKKTESNIETFWRSYIQGLGGELAKETVKLFVKGMILYMTLEASGFPIKEIAKKIQLLIAKGEFEHYDEIKDILKALRKSDPDKNIFDIRVLKGKKTGWEYVKKGLDDFDIPCFAWSPTSPKVRYYGFPLSHMLLFALGEGQFIAFSGGDSNAVKSTLNLFEYDLKNLSHD